MKTLDRLFRLIPVKLRFIAWAAIAFSSALSFIHSTSAAADAHGTGIFWTVVGAVLAVITLAIGKLANDENKDES